MRHKRTQSAEVAEQQIADIIDGLPPDEKTKLVLSICQALSEVDPRTYWAHVLDAYKRLPSAARKNLGKLFARAGGHVLLTQRERQGLEEIIELCVTGIIEAAGKRRGGRPAKNEINALIRELRERGNLSFGKIALAVNDRFPNENLNYKSVQERFRRDQQKRARRP